MIIPVDCYSNNVDNDNDDDNGQCDVPNHRQPIQHNKMVKEAEVMKAHDVAMVAKPNRPNIATSKNSSSLLVTNQWGVSNVCLWGVTNKKALTSSTYSKPIRLVFGTSMSSILCTSKPDEHPT